MKRLTAVLASALLAFIAAAIPASAQTKKPNILVIMTDDVGVWNISAYHRGMMGGRTPNIDRIANEGALFTDYYAQQSCTAGRAAFITGQHPFRTGLLTVGLPGSPLGLQKEDPTIAELLKPLGYAPAQVGKNHLGDRNEFLPTVHGFDFFDGNLYHLNAEEEPEDPDYPKQPASDEKFGPRGVLSCVALTSENTEPTDPRFGPWGKQKCEDSGPLTRKRMETAEEELLKVSLDFMDKSVKSGKPFFLWHNNTRMDVWTRLSPEWENKSGYGLYADGMMEPIKPNTIINDIASHEDWTPTFLAAAGVPDVKEQLLKGYKGVDKTFKVHLDGYDMTGILSGKSPGLRKEIFYFDDSGSLNAFRFGDWKVSFATKDSWWESASFNIQLVLDQMKAQTD